MLDDAIFFWFNDDKAISIYATNKPYSLTVYMKFTLQIYFAEFLRGVLWSVREVCVCVG